MAVTREDVLHIAELARLGVDSARADELTKELSAILAHMEVLSAGRYGVSSGDRWNRRRRDAAAAGRCACRH